MCAAKVSTECCFKSAFVLFSFTFIKKLFSFSSLFATRVVSSAYQRLLIFLWTILIPACDSSSLAFCMMYSEYKLNKQGDNRQPCRACAVHAKSLQSCLTLCDCIDCSLPGCSVHGILQAILEWIAIPSSKESFYYSPNMNQSVVPYKILTVAS